MGGVLAAYLVTTGLIAYRWGSQAHQAPPPLALGGEALIFGLTALIAQRDARFGTATAWAFTLGALLAPDLTKTAGPSQSQISSIFPATAQATPSTTKAKG